MTPFMLFMLWCVGLIVVLDLIKRRRENLGEVDVSTRKRLLLEAERQKALEFGSDVVTPAERMYTHPQRIARG